MSTSADTDKLLADLQAVLRDAEALLKATADLGGEQIQSARASAKATVEEVKSRLTDTPAELLHTARQAAEATGDYVKKNPWTAVGIAAGIGVIIGLILRSPRD